MNSLHTLACGLLLPCLLFACLNAAYEMAAWADEHVASMRREYAARWCGAHLAATRNMEAMQVWLAKHMGQRDLPPSLQALRQFKRQYAELQARYASSVPAMTLSACDDKRWQAPLWPSDAPLSVALAETVMPVHGPLLPNWHYVWRYQSPSSGLSSPVSPSLSPSSLLSSSASLSPSSPPSSLSSMIVTPNQEGS